MGQHLPVPSSPRSGGHQLHRLARAVQQQTPQIAPAPPSLIRPRERLEHLRLEVLQITPDRSQLLTQHASQRDVRSRRHAITDRTYQGPTITTEGHVFIALIGPPLPEHSTRSDRLEEDASSRKKQDGPHAQPWGAC